MLLAGVLVLPLLFTKVISALLQEVDLALKYITDLLEETLPVMEYVIFILYECQSEHKEYSR